MSIGDVISVIGNVANIGKNLAVNSFSTLALRWSGRLFGMTALSDLAGKVAGVATKIGLFGTVYSTILVVLQSWIFPMFDDVVAQFPSVLDPIRFVFQLMVATQHFIPWDDVSTVFVIFLQFMILLLAWRLAVVVYNVTTKMVSMVFGGA